MEDLDLTLEQLETWKDVDLIAEVLAMQDELKKTRLAKAHVELRLECAIARIESLENEVKIRASWQRESNAALTAIGTVIHKHACEPWDAVYEIRKIIEEETDD